MFEIGTSLRETRLHKQIEIAEAEQATKIRGKYLRALEDEQFDVLPSPTYVKGFLRSYAEYLGLDGQLYVDEYNSRYVIGEGEETAPFRSRRRAERQRVPRGRRRFESGVVLVGLAAIAVVTALVIAAWKFGGSSNGQKIQNLGSTAAAPATAAPTARHLVLRAVRGATLVEVHLGSPTGRLLFQGTLEPGRSQSFPARTVWMNVGSAENLRVTLAGRRLRIPRAHGPSRLVVTRTGLVRSAA